ncbi:branched-chain amino acid ABC transporter permease [Bradyrhizobium sp. KB893862 SZCCT0404]|uniref:branched-chain amino acid ABC transporter permease n=1 Tax=Bradyrhizobium sp. KB893862 SZCCT0404 TaxID=2807672 RepID=UPI001BA51F8B|nr:branched-chain amino acid ABC transporter permease [Bradyrhizobium sp. KB893862 SZCCT0404]MBR1172739.1 branched-chain amino acid ABC transporter permease [Bradyrhizobium sp. KB893862 SZCCT0404]
MREIVAVDVRRFALYGVVFLIACTAPLVVPSGYFLHLLVLFLIFGTLALSLSIVVGFLGELTLGQAGFFAVGAYASALLSVDQNWPFWFSLPAAGLISGLTGVLVGLPSFRLQGPYFAIVTLGFSQIIGLVITNSISITRGPMGISRIPAPTLDLPMLPTIRFNTELSFYYLALALLILVIYVVRRLLVSRTGRAIVAIRENASLAESVGIDLYRYKITAFFISTFIAGIAGAMYAHYVRVITPHLADVYYTSSALIMVVVGGAATISGALIGAFVFTILPEILRFVEDARLLVFGVILILSIHYMPKGVGPALAQLAGRLSRRGGISSGGNSK